jgi:hypothetical protein
MWYLSAFRCNGWELNYEFASCELVIRNQFTLVFRTKSGTEKLINCNDIKVIYNSYRDCIKAYLDSILGTYAGFYYEGDCFFKVDDMDTAMKFLKLFKYVTTKTYNWSDTKSITAPSMWLSTSGGCDLFYKHPSFPLPNLIFLLDLLIKYPQCYFIHDGYFYIFVDGGLVAQYKLLCSTEKFQRFITKYRVMKG